ncbi:MAG: hypothetical protein IKV86_07695, partial [Clostridia bacterium]|nr:hypothetical protein [Clostridia bacterium]
WHITVLKILTIRQGFFGFLPCTALKIEIFVVQNSFGLGIFRLREVIKNAGILAYICIFLRTISEK